MVVKQQLSDQTTDPKKRRRVGFSAIDEGVVAEECITIYLVSSKEEVDAPDSFCIDPLDVNQFFEEDGKIYGYKELKITIWVSTVSFHAYADIVYQSTSDGGKGITDLKLALQKIFADTLIETKDEFLQTFSTERHYIRSILSTGETLQYKPTNCQGSDSKNLVEAGSSDVEAIRMTLSNANAGLLYSRLVPLALLLVDGSSPIDIADPRWEIYVLAKKKIVELEEQCTLLGFTAVYRFYHYPDTSRLRLCQILVLPPYQGKGYGRDLLNILNNVAISENVYDVTVEAPLDYFQQVRTCVDTARLLHLDSIQDAVTSVATRLKEENLSKTTYLSTTLKPPSSILEDARRCLKINKKQFLQCWEVLIYLQLGTDNKYMENFVTFVSNNLRTDLIGKDSGNGGKQVIEVPSDHDPETSFVMFRSHAGNVSEGIQVDKSQNNQEEQLRQLVDERVDEIKLIAEKVSLHRAERPGEPYEIPTTV